MSMDCLPPELLMRILKLADVKSSVKLGMVCRRIYEAAQSPEVQYSILLDICGMVDSGRTSASISERLRHLRAYEIAWRTLSWVECVEIPLKPGTRFYEPKDGFSAVLYGTDSASMVEVHRLPSPLCGTSYKTWSWECNLMATALEIEPAYNLAVLAERTVPSETGGGTELRIHCRELLTGRIHPLAYEPYIRLNWPCIFRMHSRRIVYHTMEGTQPQLQVLDWTTGIIQLTLMGYTTNKIRLIGPNYAVLCNEHSIDIFQLKTSSQDPHQIASIILPKLSRQPLDASAFFDLVKDQCRGACLPSEDCLFFPDPEDETVLGFALDLGGAAYASFYIPYSLLVAVADASAKETSTPHAVPWTTLASQGAAFRPTLGGLHLFLLNGTRLCSRTLSGSFGGSVELEIELVDQSPLRVARARSAGARERPLISNDEIGLKEYTGVNVPLTPSSQLEGSYSVTIDAQPPLPALFSPESTDTSIAPPPARLVSRRKLEIVFRSSPEIPSYLWVVNDAVIAVDRRATTMKIFSLGLEENSRPSIQSP